MRVSVTGVHLYAGGFMQGVKAAGWTPKGTVETWRLPDKLRDALNISVIDQPGPSDVVISNPPCSRFSMMSTEHFSMDERHRLSDFTELQQSMDVVEACKPQVFWWETGPMASASGIPMIKSVHEELRRRWKKVTTYVVKLDLLHRRLVDSDHRVLDPRDAVGHIGVHHDAARLHHLGPQKPVTELRVDRGPAHAEPDVAVDPGGRNRIQRGEQQGRQRRGRARDHDHGRSEQCRHHRRRRRSRPAP